MIRLAYNLALGAGMLAAAPWLAARLARGRYRDIALARLGLGNAWLPEAPEPGCIWLHALSVGETASALPLLKALGERFPDRPLVFSVATAQGRKVARESLAASRVNLFVRPLDAPWSVKRLLDRLKPSLFCLVEGDIWPNWQWELKRRGVPCLLVNNRVSPRTFKGYRRLGRLSRELLSGFDCILAQTGVDRDRLLAVGLSEEKVVVGGNLKFDSAPPELGAKEKQSLARELGLSGRRVLVAGSTHQGEEEPCLDAFAGLKDRHRSLALLLAPREVDRGGEIMRLAEKRGLSAARLSQGVPPEGTEIVILDTLGILARSYAMGEAAFVGGSLVSVGGHNLLEPAAQGVPMVFGPITHNFLQMAKQLEKAGGGVRIKSGEDLAGVWGDLLANETKASDMGRAARKFCGAHRGAVARAVAEAERLLREAGHA